MKGRIWKGLACLCLLAALSGCGGEEKEKPAPQELRRPQVIRIGADTSVPPFAYSWGERHVGFDMDMAEAIVKQLGDRLVFKSMELEALIPAIQNGQIDIAMSAMEVTPERENLVAFSDVYFPKNNKIVVVMVENNEIHGWENIGGHRVGARAGTAQAYMAARAGAEVTLFRTNGDAFKALEEKTVDAVVIDAPSWQGFYVSEIDTKYMKVVGAPREARGFVLVMRKGDEELRSRVNGAIRALREDGSWDYYYNKWFTPGK